MYLTVAFTLMIVLLIIWGSKLTWMWDKWEDTIPPADHFVAFWTIVGLFILAIVAGFIWPAAIPVGIGFVGNRCRQKKLVRQEAAKKEAARQQAVIDREVQLIKVREGWV